MVSQGSTTPKLNKNRVVNPLQLIQVVCLFALVPCSFYWAILYLEEWYPHVPIFIDLKLINSIKLIESTIYPSNININMLYANCFMTGKVFYSELFLNIGSRLFNNPLQIEFIFDMIEDRKEESNLVTLKVTPYFSKRSFKDVANELLNESPIKFLGK
jgi:hypothetical protein